MATKIYRSNSITFLNPDNSRDASLAEKIYVVTDTVEIKKFYTEEKDSDGKKQQKITLSPKESIHFQLVDESNNPLITSKPNIQIQLIVDGDNFNTKRIALGNECLDIDEINPTVFKLSFEKNITVTQAGVSSVQTIQDCIQNSNGYLVISYGQIVNNLFKSSAATEIRFNWALNDDYAKFQMSADKILASVNNSSLNLDENGLTLVVASNLDLDTGAIHGLKIQRKNYDGSLTSVFSVDSNGTGTFSGIVNASGGRFGLLEIVDETITSPHFSLDQNGITVNNGVFNGNIILSETGSISNGQFTLNSDGLIANKIDIIDGEIKNYLKIGENCWIFNTDLANASTLPDEIRGYWRSGDFLRIQHQVVDEDGIGYNGYLTINSNGQIDVSKDGIQSITLDAETGTLSCQEPGKVYWQLDKNEAKFNNISAQGSIKCATFEYGEIQTVGGAILLRPSSIIKDAYRNENNIVCLKLESATGFELNSFCKISTDILGGGQIVRILSVPQISITTGESNNIITVSINDEPEYLDLTEWIGKTITDFGRGINANEETNAYGIGLNSSDNGSFLNPRAITLNNFYYNASSKNIDYTPKVILGYVPANNTKAYGRISGKYGLYADNVYVKGMLMSSNGKENSGIDTLSAIPVAVELRDFFKELVDTVGAETTFFINENGVITVAQDSFAEKTKQNTRTGNIVIWAGAQEETDEGIQHAPFWVDSKGNMYASSGYFEGAIISKSTIQASEIKTATITGTNEADEYGLVIQTPQGANNMSKAIRFCNEDDSPTSYFELTSKYMLLSGISTKIGGSGSKYTDVVETELNNRYIKAPMFVTNFSSNNDSSENLSTDYGMVSTTKIGLYKNSEFTGIIRNEINNKIQLQIKNSSVISYEDKQITVEDGSNINILGQVSFGENAHIETVKQQDGTIIGFDIKIY